MYFIPIMLGLTPKSVTQGIMRKILLDRCMYIVIHYTKWVNRKIDSCFPQAAAEVTAGYYYTNNIHI